MGKAKRQAEKAARSALGVKPKASNKLARKAAARGAAETPRAAVTAASSPGAAAAQPSTIKARGAAPSRPSAVADLSGAAGRAAADRKAFRGKPLILCARGITHRFRHLMTDLQQLAPHHKTDSKLDTKHDWQAINEIAELKGATAALFFEARKRKDLYVWLARPPAGPTARFLASNVHTMAELKMSGNHLRASRPALAFDAAFDEQPHLQVIKELLQQVFVTPRGHQKSKPFFDHVISFAWADHRVWLRNHQVVPPADRRAAKRGEGVTLVEVGPRVTLQPIKVFEGSFRGRVLFENPEFVTPNAVRAYERRASAGGYDARKRAERRREAHRASLASEPDPMAERAVFAAPGAARDADTSGLSGDEDEDEEEDDIVGDPDR